MPAVTGNLEVELPWRDGGTIPRRYTCDGADAAPRVRVPGTNPERLAIVMTDPDAPNGTFVHWTRWGSVEGENSFGKTGYGGPCPPKGDKPHRYVITVYSLKSRLGLERGAKPDEVVQAVKKLAVASGSSTGLYGR